MALAVMGEETVARAVEYLRPCALPGIARRLQL